MCELALFAHSDAIRREHASFEARLGVGRMPRIFLFEHVTLARILSLRYSRAHCSMLQRREALLAYRKTDRAHVSSVAIETSQHRRVIHVRLAASTIAAAHTKVRTSSISVENPIARRREYPRAGAHTKT